MRVGAKAVECLSILKDSRAVHFYRDYPKVHHLFIVCLLYLNELIRYTNSFDSSPFQDVYVFAFPNIDEHELGDCSKRKIHYEFS